MGIHSTHSMKAQCVPSILPTENSGCHLMWPCQQWGNFPVECIQEVAAIVTKHQMCVAGHILPLPEHRYPKNTVWWEPPERKWRWDRSCKTWHQTFKNNLQTVDIKWIEAEGTAIDRIHWKKLAVLCTSRKRNWWYTQISINMQDWKMSVWVIFVFVTVVFLNVILFFITTMIIVLNSQLNYMSLPIINAHVVSFETKPAWFEWSQFDRYLFALQKYNGKNLGNNSGSLQHYDLSFRKCAMISAHYGLSDVFDNLIISLCKFTALSSEVSCHMETYK